jgi:hypothetical protein
MPVIAYFNAREMYKSKLADLPKYLILTIPLFLVPPLVAVQQRDLGQHILQ